MKGRYAFPKFWRKFPYGGRHGFLVIALFVVVVAVACAGSQSPAVSEAISGPQGLAGPAGLAGSAGSQGPQGLAGSAGSQGPQGLVGPAGIQGAQGPAGPAGSQGPQGSAGKMAQAAFEGAMTINFADAGTTIGTVTARPDHGEVNGARATLRRSADKIHSIVQTKGEPGYTYTMWWEIYVNGAREIVLWADGGVAGDDGQLSFEGSIENGDIIQLKNEATVLKLFDPTLEAPYTIDLSDVTKIGIVIVDHGPPQLGLRGAQIGTRGGGCTIGTEKGGKAGPFGTYDCSAVQDIEY